MVHKTTCCDIILRSKKQVSSTSDIDYLSEQKMIEFIFLKSDLTIFCSNDYSIWVSLWHCRVHYVANIHVFQILACAEPDSIVLFLLSDITKPTSLHSLITCRFLLGFNPSLHHVVVASFSYILVFSFFYIFPFRIFMFICHVFF